MEHEAGAGQATHTLAQPDHSCRPENRRVEDRRLVAAARGDPAAYAALYRRYVGPVYRYFYHHVGNPQDTEDLTATTFRKALAGLSRYREQDSFAAWLFSIARHTLLDYQRRHRPQIDVELVASTLVDPAPQPDAQILRVEQARTLHRLIRELPADQREALVLRFFAQLPTAAIAMALGRSEGAVKMLIHRAVTRLRDRYRQEDEP